MLTAVPLCRERWSESCPRIGQAFMCNRTLLPHLLCIHTFLVESRAGVGRKSGALQSCLGIMFKEKDELEMAASCVSQYQLPFT